MIEKLALDISLVLCSSRRVFLICCSW